MQQDLSCFFEEYLAKESIFKDRGILNSKHTPETLLHREDQTKALAQILAPSLKGERASNVFIYGKTGTGKTVTVSFTTENILKVAKEHHLPIQVIYANCKLGRIADTEYRLLANLCNKLGEEVPSTGLSTGQVYNTFKALVDKEAQVVILVLDEIDELVKKTDDAFLYNLTRLNAELQQAKVSFVGIANNVSFIENLDPRVRSSLNEEELLFPCYNALQICDILKQREEKAFHEGIVNPGVLEKCAAFAARDHGDARRAIELLRVAGEIAERNSFRNVTIEHLDQAEEKIERDRMLDVVRIQPKQYQLVVYGILSLWERNTRSLLSTGEVYECYKGLCEHTNLPVLTQRRISDIIADLDTQGVVSVEVISKGRYGRTRNITPSVQREVSRNMKKLLAKNLDLTS